MPLTVTKQERLILAVLVALLVLGLIGRLLL